MAKEFNIDIEHSEVPSTPLPATSLRQKIGRATAKEVYQYQKRVGKLNYAAVITRPDIAHGVSKLSEYLQNPSKHHIKAAEHMLRYLIGTRYKGIEFDGEPIYAAGRKFIASNDATFADNVLTKCSSCVFCFKLFHGIIYWKAIKQKTVTTSSTEVELLAITVTAKEYIWWIRLFKHLNVEIDSPVILFDNQQNSR